MAPSQGITLDCLPTLVLARILNTDAKAQYRAQLSVCTAFAKATLCSGLEPQLTLNVEESRPGLVPMLQWVVECQGCFRPRLLLRREGMGSASMKPWCLMLKQAELTLPLQIVECRRLFLDAPGGLVALLPNLQELQLTDCLINPSIRPLTGCTRLRHLVISSSIPRSQVGPGCLALLDQLAELPSLASLEFNTRHFPTAFLPALSGQLTRLRLISDVPGLPADQQAALVHVGQLTSLRHLELGSFTCTLQQLAQLSTLPHLSTLHLGMQRIDSDELISALLRFPHLTSVALDRLSFLSQSYTDRLCGWKELTLDAATPDMIARLPMQSLQTLRLDHLEVCIPIGLDDPNDNPEVEEIAAAVLNLRWGPQPVRLLSSSMWAKRKRKAEPAKVFLSLSFDNRGEWIDMEPEEQDAFPSPAARLKAVMPLVPEGITNVELLCVKVDAGLVVALRQLVPDKVTSINLNSCLMDPSCWSELARSFPRLKDVRVSPTVELDPVALMGYFCAAALMQGQAGETPHAADITVECYEKEHVEGYTETFHGLNEQLRFLGFTAAVVVKDMS